MCLFKCNQTCISIKRQNPGLKEWGQHKSAKYSSNGYQNPVNLHRFTCQKAQLPYNFHGLPCHQNMVFFGFKDIQGDDGQNAKREITKQWPAVVDNDLVATSIFYIHLSGITTLWPLTGDMSNTYCLFITAPVSRWDMLGRKWTFCPQSWWVGSRKNEQA